ncbi:hypothetical protein IGI37_000775 [Enterococcus sp. AZ194]|uniref:sugar transferase n=1 Tax=Enterococcus sp. AZ194 TaxID=2774629 RepID=UPI003F205F4A
MNEENEDVSVERPKQNSSGKMISYLFCKRLLDIIGGLVGVILILLVYLILFVPYKFGNDKGEIFFKQKRVGKKGKIFYVYKFRSMKVDADAILRKNEYLYKKYIENDYKLEADEDPRITKLGLFIRKYSIDEIPQFINVLKGDMSLVGPRPIVVEELNEYERLSQKEQFLSMKPGITGVWQTSGRSTIGYPERVDLETSYSKNTSIIFDLKIIFKTFYKVLKKEGAY